MLKKEPCHIVPESFLNKHRGKITGFLSGLDRVRFHGCLRMLAQPTIAKLYLERQNVLLKDFKEFAEATTKTIRAVAVSAATALGRPVVYLPSSAQSKEELASEIARKDGVNTGLVAVFSVVEPCQTYTVVGNREAKMLELSYRPGKCIHLYHYHQHPKYGSMHVRVQTWMPWSVDICMNGREWLARSMDAEGLGYEKRDNCFARLKDMDRAQELMDEQLKKDWEKALFGLLDEAHPLHRKLSAPLGQPYYWSASATEYATDVMFRRETDLAAIYPALLHHGIRTFGSADILRFLGHREPAKFRGEVTSTLKRRPEGVRIKHSANGNSLKMYDKQGSVLRVETTINHTREFKVYRASDTDPQHKCKWMRMRSGVADLWRRCEISRKANERYLSALASVENQTTLKEQTRELCRPVTIDGRRHRAINVFDQTDAQLLQTVSAGDYAINGWRNRDLRKILFGETTDRQEGRRQSAAITRKLALLRAHGLIRKVSGTHRWMLTEHGRFTVTAVLAAREASVVKLAQMAA